MCNLSNARAVIGIGSFTLLTIFNSIRLAVLELIWLRFYLIWFVPQRTRLFTQFDAQPSSMTQVDLQRVPHIPGCLTNNSTFKLWNIQRSWDKELVLEITLYFFSRNQIRETRRKNKHTPSFNVNPQTNKIIFDRVIGNNRKLCWTKG